MSKRYMPGKRFASLDEVRGERVVYVVPWKRAHPVAFFLSWQWRLVDSWVRGGHIRRAVAVNEQEGSQ